jgi:hypothetical protein
MSEHQNQQNDPSPRNRALAVGVGLVATLAPGVMPVTAYAEQAPGSPNPPVLADMHPEHLSVTSNESAFESRTTVRVGNFCSGSLETNSKGKTVGVILATHCIADRPGWKITPLTDKLSLRTAPKPITISSGDHETDLKTVARVSAFITSKEGNANDTALAVMPWETPQQTLASYHPLTTKQIAGYRKGTKIILSGWPEKQRGQIVEKYINKYTVVKRNSLKNRQEFAMRLIGTDVIMNDQGQPYEVAVALANTNENDAGCTPGESGGVARIAHPIKKIGSASAIIGPQSRYYDLDQPTDNYHLSGPEERAWRRADIEKRFGVSTEGMRFICYFSIGKPGEEYQPPAISDVPGTIHKGGPDEHSDPAPTPPEEIGGPPMDPLRVLTNKFNDEFNDKNVVKMSVDGYARYDISETNSIWLKNPLVFYDPSTERAMIGFTTDKAEGKLQFAYLPVLEKLTFYGEPGETDLSLHRIKGEIDYSSDDSGESYGKYTGTDSNGDAYEFGEQLQQEPQVNGHLVAKLTYVSGLVLQKHESVVVA